MTIEEYKDLMLESFLVNLARGFFTFVGMWLVLWGVGQGINWVRELFKV